MLNRGCCDRDYVVARSATWELGAVVLHVDDGNGANIQTIGEKIICFPVIENRVNEHFFLLTMSSRSLPHLALGPYWQQFTTSLLLYASLNALHLMVTITISTISEC